MSNRFLSGSDRRSEAASKRLNFAGNPTRNELCWLGANGGDVVVLVGAGVSEEKNVSLFYTPRFT